MLRSSARRASLHKTMSRGVPQSSLRLGSLVVVADRRHQVVGVPPDVSRRSIGNLERKEKDEILSVADSRCCCCCCCKHRWPVVPPSPFRTSRTTTSTHAPLTRLHAGALLSSVQQPAVSSRGPRVLSTGAEAPSAVRMSGVRSPSGGGGPLHPGAPARGAARCQREDGGAGGRAAGPDVAAHAASAMSAVRQPRGGVLSVTRRSQRRGAGVGVHLHRLQQPVAVV
eukprot:ctg_2401.g669